MHQVRVGFIGAGENTRVRHLPGFRKIPGVELTAVANRTTASATQVAREFGISRVLPRWQDVIADPKIDAVCIGTWPDLHAEATCAALAAGKHVLCEARMSRNLDEALRMQAAATARPELVAQLVPSPFGLEHHAFLTEIIEDGFIGELREVVVLGADNQFWDETRPLHWRQDAAISGFNCLSLGILHETLSRFVPRTTRVFAQSAWFEPVRRAAEGRATHRVTVPESLQVVTQIEGGARGVYHLSGMILHGPGKQIHLYGRKGTIKLMFGAREEMFCGRMGQTELTRVDLAPESRGGWKVEEDFIAAIRGGARSGFTDFASGVAYMEFTEAVARSLETDLPVSLPLA
jgi:predicted dehydrogenase